MVICEVIIQSEDVGEVVEGVEVLIKKYEDFIKIFVVQDVKINVLKDNVDWLIDNNYYDFLVIVERIFVVLVR